MLAEVWPVADESPLFELFPAPERLKLDRSFLTPGRGETVSVGVTGIGFVCLPDVPDLEKSIPAGDGFGLGAPGGGLGGGTFGGDGTTEADDKGDREVDI